MPINKPLIAVIASPPFVIASEARRSIVEKSGFMESARPVIASAARQSMSATRLGYAPTHHIGEGLKVAMAWHIQHLTQQGKA